MLTLTTLMSSAKVHLSDWARVVVHISLLNCIVAKLAQALSYMIWKVSNVIGIEQFADAARAV